MGTSFRGKFRQRGLRAETKWLKRPECGGEKEREKEEERTRERRRTREGGKKQLDFY